jgi:hypothetical protein
MTGLQQPKAFEPLGSMFNNVLNDYYTRSLIAADNRAAVSSQNTLNAINNFSSGAIPAAPKPL